MRVLIIGDGKMGRAVESLAAAGGHRVVAILGATANADTDAIRSHRGEVDVAIEVTVPGSAATNAIACIDSGIPVVVGTTGWYDQRPMVEQRARDAGGAILIAPNFSLGVALATDVMRAAGQAFAPHDHFAAALVETHHAAKQDAPSGTAEVDGRRTARSPGPQVPITSVRVGAVPGTHTLIFDGRSSRLSLRTKRVTAGYRRRRPRAAAWLWKTECSRCAM
jgi:4-hydroxy-tetrahydrodipicolinate reductase